MKSIKVLAALTVAFLIIGCARYKTNIDVQQGKKLSSALSRIVCIAEVRKDKDDEWIEKRTRGGVSFSIGNGLQIGLTHATDLPEKYIQMSRFGPYGVKREVRNKKYFIDDIEIILLTQKGDVSIFKKPYESDVIFKLGVDPGMGTNLFVIGDTMLKGNNWKTGIVSMLKSPLIRSMDLSNSFVHTVPTNGGDSGSPILAEKHDGSYEVVGILNASFTRSQSYNTGVYISFVKELLDTL